VFWPELGISVLKWTGYGIPNFSKFVWHYQKNATGKNQNRDHSKIVQSDDWTDAGL
jgi:hypothetical protein